MLQVRHLHLSPLFIVVATACQGNVAAGWLPLPSLLAPVPFLHVVQPFFYIIYTLNVVYDAVDTFQGAAASRKGRAKQKGRG